MLAEGLDGLLPGDLPAVPGGDQHGDDVAVGHGGMDQDAGGFHVGHDGHEIHRLVGGRLVDLQGVGEPPMIVAGIGHPPDDGDGHLLHAVETVQAVHRPDEARGVAAGELQIVLAQALLVVGVAVEEHVRHGILLAALEDGLHAHLLIELLVLGAYAAGGGIQHDVHLPAQLLEGARHGDVVFLEGGRVSPVHQIQVVLHAVRADHVVLPQRSDGQGGGEIRDAHQLHVALHGDAVRQPLPDGAVTGHAYFDLSHGFFSFYKLLYHISSTRTGRSSLRDLLQASASLMDTRPSSMPTRGSVPLAMHSMNSRTSA